MLGGDGSGPREVSLAIDRLTKAIRSSPACHFDPASVERLTIAVQQLRESVEQLNRSPFAALVGSGVKQGAQSLILAFEDLARTMKTKP